ncbi:MAG: phage tail protein [Anaerolineae bacterium]
MVVLEAHKALAPPDQQRWEERSRLLDYLPSIYSDSDMIQMAGFDSRAFLNGFLLIFDSIWMPLERQIDELFAYFDPHLTPEEFLPWLGGWLGLSLDENWPAERQRMFIQQAVDLYLRRGTAGELRDYLTLYTGVTPQIFEDGDTAHPFHFSVVFRSADLDALAQERAPLPSPEEVAQMDMAHADAQQGSPEADAALAAQLREDIVRRTREDILERIRHIIESEKPSHTTYTLREE